MESGPPNPKKNQVRLPKIYDYNFDDPKEPKAWRSGTEDITDYFNYGFNEETWRLHVEKVRELHARLPLTKNGKNLSLLVNRDLPVDIGGFGNPANPGLASMELFQSLANNPERFWLGLDLAGEGKFWKSLDLILKDHSNAYDASSAGTVNEAFFFNKYHTQVKQFLESQDIEATKIFSKQNAKRIKDRIAGRTSDRLETGYRQHQYTQNQGAFPRDDGLLGRRGNLGAPDPRDLPNKATKK